MQENTIMQENHPYKPEYIKEQKNYNCQQFYGDMHGCVFSMPGSHVHMGSSSSEEKSEASNTSSLELSIEDRILLVYKSNVCRHQSDWGVVFRLMLENKDIVATDYVAFAELVNRVCGAVVTTADSVRVSKACTSLGGSYRSGWRDTNPSRQTISMLRRYNAIGDVYWNR